MYTFHNATNNLNFRVTIIIIVYLYLLHMIDLKLSSFYVKQQEFTANPEEFTSQEELLGYLVSVKSYLAR